MKSNKPKQMSSTIYAAVIRGVVSALAITLIGSIFGALLWNQESVPEGSAFFITVIIWAIAGFVGSILSINTISPNPLLSLMLTNACYILILLGVGILFFDSDFGNIFTALLVVIAGGIPAVLFYFNRTPKKHKKIRYKQ